MWTIILMFSLVFNPIYQARMLLDLQDLHPDLPGTLPKSDDPAIAASEGQFNKDMTKSAEVEAIDASTAPAGEEFSSLAAAGTATDIAGTAEVASEVAGKVEPVGASEVASGGLSEVASGGLTEVASESTSQVASGGLSKVASESATKGLSELASEGLSTGGGDGGEADEDWGWDAYDEPDADTWFYDADESRTEDAGWTWDDAQDAQGDNNWDTEWLPAERDESFSGHVNATWNAMMTHVSPGISSAGTTAVDGKALVRAGVSKVLNIEEHPKNHMLLEVLTFLPMLPPLLLIAFLVRAASLTMSMHGLVQFACLFCAGYSGLLIVAAVLTGDEPLAAFQFMAGHGAYIKYQFLVATAYTLFLALLYVNVCVQRCGSMALIQQVLGTTIGLHYYLGTFHPAMIALPPESVVGLSVGVPTYFFYMFIFFLMGVLPERTKAVGEEEEDDKTYGGGKGQD